MQNKNTFWTVKYNAFTNYMIHVGQFKIYFKFKNRF